MTIAFITGTSSGLGKAIAELLLDNNDIHVVGISRSKTIDKINYKHLNLDLSIVTDVSSFEFPTGIYDKYILINNAGVISPISHLGHDFNTDIDSGYKVNLISPSILINTFIKQFANLGTPMHIINVSSGAGKYPTDGWSVYNASKAGIDMFSLALKKELIIDNRNYVNIHSVAPGVVDTKMQSSIRKCNSEDFSTVSKFAKYYDDNTLSNPSDVAIKFKKIIDNPESVPEVIIYVRDF